MSRTTRFCRFCRFGFCVTVCLCLFWIVASCAAEEISGSSVYITSLELGTISTDGCIGILPGGIFSGDNIYGFLGNTLTPGTGGTFGSGDRIAGNTSLSGDVILNAGAVIAPGNSIGTISVTGDYTHNEDATLEIEINAAGANDWLKVSGAATINGGTVQVLPEDTLYTDRIYTFLTAAGGVTGEFDSVVTENMLFYDTSLIYNSTSVQLRVFHSYAASAQTSNQRAVGDYLNDHSSGLSGLNKLNNLTTPEEARVALDSFSGELYGSLLTVGIENTGNFLQTLASRLRSRSLGQRSVYVAPVSQRAEEETLVVIRGQQAFGWARQGMLLQNASRPTSWAEGYGTAAQIGSDGNASGLDYTTGGTAFGIEQNLNQNTLLGVVGGYGQTTVKMDCLNDWSRINSAQAGLYVQHDRGYGYLTGIAAYGYNGYETRRYVMPQVSDYASRKASRGNEFSFYLETGRNYYFPIAYVQPFAAVQYVQLHQNQIHENDTESLSLQIGGIHADSFRGLLGLRTTYDYQLPNYQLLLLEGRALWRHEFLDETPIFDARFDGVADGTFTVQGLTVDRDVAILGGGLTFCLRTGSELYANYDLLISQNYTAHAGSGGLMLAW